jgi:monothiol glutaredoxin
MVTTSVKAFWKFSAPQVLATATATKIFPDTTDSYAHSGLRADKLKTSFELDSSGPITMSIKDQIQATVSSNPVVLYMKGTASFPQCGFSGRAIQILKACGVENIVTVNVLEDPEIRQGIKEFSNWPTVPQLYVNGEFIGGSDIMTEMYQAGELQALLGQKS